MEIAFPSLPVDYCLKIKAFLHVHLEAKLMTSYPESKVNTELIQSIHQRWRRKCQYSKMLICFAFHCSMIHLKNVYHLHVPNQWNTNKQKATCSQTLMHNLSHNWPWLQAFSLSIQWFTVLLKFALTGHCSYFGFRTVNWNLILNISLAIY